MGYKIVDKRLVINPDEAEVVRFIFQEKEKDREFNSKSSYDDYSEDEEVIIPITKKYIESLDEEEFIKEEDDESIVNTNTIHIGGILDNKELNKINDILREEVIQNEINLEKSDWKDIAAIIDDALDEVKEYEFDLTQVPTKTYNLVLSNFHINELRPLLEKFDQTVIDKLSSGESVDIRLSLKA